MKRLAELFSVRRRFLRSVHVASDARRADACEGYALTPLGRATLARVLDGLGAGRTERAWTLTGPYGAGKSAFVVMLAQLLCKGSAVGTETALRELRAADRSLPARIERLRGARGFCPVLVSGTYGPLLPRLLDAAERAVGQTFHAGALQSGLLGELKALRGGRPKVSDLHQRVLAFFEHLAEAATQKGGGGVLLVIDELGKCLEYAARGPERSDDVFLLQELAEAAARSEGRPMVLVTLLHQSFDRYARDVAASRRAEWEKVQGRFEDVAFLDAPGELLRLAGRTIQRREERKPELYRAYDALADEAVALGLAPEEQLTPLRQLAPLHPVVALLLPALCRGPLAQNERSLFSFLSSSADGALGAFLNETEAARDAAPTYAVDRLYDYLAATLGPAQYALVAGKRWATIDEALARLPDDAPPLCARLVKAVGLLALLGTKSLRPSREVLGFALRGHGADGAAFDAAVERLVAASVVVHRRHSDAYALWEGSDVDLDACFEAASQRPPGIEEITAALQTRMVLRPWVARRHFFETGTLRHFDVSLGSADALAAAPGPGDADGRIVYLLPRGDESRAELVKSASSAPRGDVVYGVPFDAHELLSRAREWCAWEAVRGGVRALEGDAVARRELSARSAHATERLEASLRSCFDLAEGARVEWVHAGATKTWRGARELSSALSAVCDDAYPSAPRVRNELLNRRTLSSAAAAARRSLLDAMNASAHLPRLGIEGAPPEFSMYASVLQAGGLHREREGAWKLGPPPPEDPLRLAPVWRRIEEFLSTTEAGQRPLRQLFDELAKRPFGVREGLAPVLFFSVALATPGEVAFFEDGSFVAELTSAVIERMLRQLDRFTVASFRIDGARAEVLRALHDALGLDGAASGPAEIVRAVVLRLKRLPRYAQNTRSVGVAAVAVRDCASRAHDPLKLLFRDLPSALGLGPVERGFEGDAAALGADLAGRLAEVLRELGAAHPALLVSIERKVAARLAIDGEREEFRSALAARARPIAAITTDLRLKAFVNRAVDARPEHAAWLEGLAMVVGNRPPAEWTDGEVARFDAGLEEVRALFLRAEELASIQRPAPRATEELRAIEGAEREILRVLEGRLGPQREVWLAALRRTLRNVLDPAGAGDERGPTPGTT